jgi:Ca2+-binding RTX toxin-like protein
VCSRATRRLASPPFAGGGQTSATALTTIFNEVVTAVATAADSVKLPAPSKVGQIVIVTNAHASNSMQVFGAGTDTINGVATATGVAQAAGKTAAVLRGHDRDRGEVVSPAERVSDEPGGCLVRGYARARLHQLDKVAAKVVGSDRGRVTDSPAWLKRPPRSLLLRHLAKGMSQEAAYEAAGER